MPRFFTHEQARQLLPEVDRLLRSAISARDGLVAAEADFSALKQKIQWMGGVRFDPVALALREGQRQSSMARLRKALDTLAELGVQLKDIESGLVDFPTLYRGQEVLLCWRLGEPAISAWHGTEEGFRGRRKIDPEFLANHAGDASH